MTQLYYPLQSLRAGHWFKLICGASFQHLPAVRNLVLAYTIAGADCVDVAADPAVISVAREALSVAAEMKHEAAQRGYSYRGSPWLMVSFNDGEDPHFRKAEFSPEYCPPECPRPCETICPVQAISALGVVSDRCYGCGRCLPVCPIQHITTRSYVSTPTAIAPLVMEYGVDAIELHTQVGRLADFTRLWHAIRPWVDHLKLVAISCPDGEGLIDYLRALYDLISPLPCPLIWQTDGRPMSGDIGTGATRAAVKLGQKVLAAGLPGYVQLAGGTNQHTTAKLRAIGLLRQTSDAGFQSHQAYIAGIAYGSYARTLLNPVLDRLEAGEFAVEADMPTATTTEYCSVSHSTSTHETNLSTHLICEPSSSQVISPIRLENSPKLLWQAVDLAHSLVSQVKAPSSNQHSSLEP